MRGIGGTTGLIDTRPDQPMRRVSVVGNPGSGKSTLGRRLAGRVGLPFYELDDLQFEPQWRIVADEVFADRVAVISAAETWVVAGNYSRFTINGPLWQRADTIVWVDPPRAVVMGQLLTRTVRRIVTRQEVCNGNYETWRRAVSRDPEVSLIRFAANNFDRKRQRYAALMDDPAWQHKRWVRIASRRAARTWLNSLPTSLTVSS